MKPFLISIGKGFVFLIYLRKEAFLNRRSLLFGAVLYYGNTVGAIFVPLFVLGIEVKNDGRTLFALVNVILFSCLTLIFLNRNKISNLLN